MLWCHKQSAPRPAAISDAVIRAAPVPNPRPRRLRARAMSKVLGVILLLATALHCLEARVTESQCRQFPKKNKHCHLEYGTWQRESNQVLRYVYDWGGRRCVAWHWWTDPSRCSLPVDENNFASEQECLAACAGWA